MRMKRCRGISLVELVVVLTIVALVASLSSTLVARVAASQQDNRGRLVLAQSADTTLARIADELQAALPNSLRLVVSGNQWWLEWVPVLDAGRYRAAVDTVSATPGDPLNLENAADASFDLIGSALGSLASGSQLVIQNLGTPDADAYSGNNRRTGLVLSNAGRTLAFTPAGALPQAADTRRAFIVGTPLTLACIDDGAGGYQLQRYSGYGWQTTQPSGATSAVLAAATKALMLSGLASCAASYSTALANIGLLNLRLSLGGGAAKAELLHQITVDNTP